MPNCILGTTRNFTALKLKVKFVLTGLLRTRGSDILGHPLHHVYKIENKKLKTHGRDWLSMYSFA